MIIPEKQSLEFKENTILEVKSGILIMESKILEISQFNPFNNCHWNKILHIYLL